MLAQLSAGLLAVLLSAISAFAQFQGVLTMNLTVVSQDGRECGGGTITMAIAKAGMRGEINLRLDQGAGMNRVVLCKADTPNTNYIITDADRTYTEIDLTPPAESESPKQEQAQWTVKKLGRAKLLGYKTQHVLAMKTGTGQSMELWVATDLLDFDTYRKLQAGSGGGTGGEESLAQALKAAGAEGMPLKAVLTAEDGGKVRLEVVKAEKKALPAATFEIPAGYTKLGGGISWKHR